MEHIGTDNYATKIALSAKQYKKVHSDLMNALNKIVKFTGFFILPLGALLFLHAYFILKQPLDFSVTSTAAALLGMLPKGAGASHQRFPDGGRDQAGAQEDPGARAVLH